MGCRSPEKLPIIRSQHYVPRCGLWLRTNCKNPTPKTLVSDGAANFQEAYNQEFRTANLETRTEHIRHIRLQGDFNNSKMERMNGEIRDREKVMRPH
jgi:hypothetical protein